MKNSKLVMLFVFLLSISVVPPISNFCGSALASDHPFYYESRTPAARVSPSAEAGVKNEAPCAAEDNKKQRYYFSKIVCRTYPKLYRANSDIKDLENSIRAIAPGISNLTNWNDRITGFSGIIIGKPINDKWDYNFVSTFARGSIDTTTAAAVQTVIPAFVPLNGARLNAYFRQEYCTKTVGFGGRYNIRRRDFTLGLSAYMDYLEFNSYTDYTLRAPGFSRVASAHFHKRKFFPVFSALVEKQVRKNTSLILFCEYIPSCKLSGVAYGDDVTNGAYARAEVPVEIDLATRKPNVGIMVCSRF